MPFKHHWTIHLLLRYTPAAILASKLLNFCKTRPTAISPLISNRPTDGWTDSVVKGWYFPPIRLTNRSNYNQFWVFRVPFHRPARPTTPAATILRWQVFTEFNRGPLFFSQGFFSKNLKVRSSFHPLHNFSILEALRSVNRRIPCGYVWLNHYPRKRHWADPNVSSNELVFLWPCKYASG